MSEREWVGIHDRPRQTGGDSHAPATVCQSSSEGFSELAGSAASTGIDGAHDSQVEDRFAPIIRNADSKPTFFGRANKSDRDCSRDERSRSAPVSCVVSHSQLSGSERALKDGKILDLPDSPPAVPMGKVIEDPADVWIGRIGIAGDGQELRLRERCRQNGK